MQDMFSGCKNFNSDLNNWNISNVKLMDDMFKNSKLARKKPSWYHA
jgi:surface protein